MKGTKRIMIETIKTKGIPIRCYRCGRIIFINIRNNRTGCRNTKCRGYLLGSKHLGNDVLKQFYR